MTLEMYLALGILLFAIVFFITEWLRVDVVALVVVVALMLTGLLKPAERGTIKFDQKYLVSLAEGAGLQIQQAQAHGVVLPNKTPPGAVPLLKRVEPLMPLPMYNLVVARV